MKNPKILEILIQIGHQKSNPHKKMSQIINNLTLNAVSKKNFLFYALLFKALLRNWLEKTLKVM